MIRKAFELAYRFDIVGPIVPCRHQAIPPEAVRRPELDGVVFREVEVR